MKMMKWRLLLKNHRIIMLTLALLLCFLVSCHGQQFVQGTAPIATDEHPGTLLFDIDSASFEVEDKDGKKLSWEKDHPSANSELDLISKEYQLGSLGRTTGSNTAFMTIELPYSEQFIFRTTSAGMAVRERETPAMLRFYGEGIRKAVWKSAELELTGEASDCGVALYRSVAEGKMLRMEMQFYLEDKTSLAWSEDAVTIHGAIDTLKLSLWDTAGGKSKLETVIVHGGITVDTSQLKDNKLIITDDTGSNTIELTWENN